MFSGLPSLIFRIVYNYLTSISLKKNIKTRRFSNLALIFRYNRCETFYSHNIDTKWNTITGFPSIDWSDTEVRAVQQQFQNWLIFITKKYRTDLERVVFTCSRYAMVELTKNMNFISLFLATCFPMHLNVYSTGCGWKKMFMAPPTQAEAGTKC